MQVILLDKVGNLGNLGDVVKVKDGYARNYLIPQRMARRATAAAIEEFEAKRAELKRQRQKNWQMPRPRAKTGWSDCPDPAEIRCGRPSVRFRHQFRYRRSTDQTRLRYPQSPSSPATRSIQDRW